MCGFLFTGENGLSFHIEVEHRTQPTLESQVLCEVRIEDQEEERPSSCVFCPFCKLESKNLDTLKTHIENIHINTNTKTEQEENDIQTIDVACTECGNSFPDNMALQRHFDVHG